MPSSAAHVTCGLGHMLRLPSSSHPLHPGDCLGCRLAQVQPNGHRTGRRAVLQALRWRRHAYDAARTGQQTCAMAGSFARGHSCCTYVNIHGPCRVGFEDPIANVLLQENYSLQYRYHDAEQTFLDWSVSRHGLSPNIALQLERRVELAS
jgi:hypothetical protein